MQPLLFRDVDLTDTEPRWGVEHLPVQIVDIDKDRSAGCRKAPPPTVEDLDAPADHDRFRTHFTWPVVDLGSDINLWLRTHFELQSAGSCDAVPRGDAAAPAQQPSRSSGEQHISMWWPGSSKGGTDLPRATSTPALPLSSGSLNWPCSQEAATRRAHSNDRKKAGALKPRDQRTAANRMRPRSQ
eukprot:gnl/TRDRNA2_/TRDRNA2_197880_c0_seq1.p1 gnl/TRDRNA2_/TRDRNA2_197880_c0~~gnl/TRDRNA2_/TRDRNA2_197880_c0_seq1.p1  ORF type:complete len:185 (+),score=22.46 gnl/TRDRNA2_/TRDRNA2_197880_c0_seq1:67-621(+)